MKGNIIRLAVLCLLATPVLAEPILSKPIEGSVVSQQTRYRINPDLGRAWIEVETTSTNSDISDVLPVLVSGLRFDADRQKVVFENNGQKVDCADVKRSGWWILAGYKITPTGACELTHRVVKKPVDNGFVVDDVQHFEVRFSPKKS